MDEEYKAPKLVFTKAMAKAARGREPVIDKDVTLFDDNGTPFEAVVKVKKLTHRQLVDLQAPGLTEDWERKIEAIKSFKIRFLQQCLCDEDGKLMCDGKNDGDYLRDMTSDNLEAIYDAAEEVNPFGEKRKEAIEEAAKN